MAEKRGFFAGISQAGQCEVIIDTADPILDSLIIHIPWIICADRLAPRGAEAAMGCRELVIVTLKRIQKEITNRRRPRKAKPIVKIYTIKSTIGKQWS